MNCSAQSIRSLSTYNCGPGIEESSSIFIEFLNKSSRKIMKLIIKQYHLESIQLKANEHELNSRFSDMSLAEMKIITVTYFDVRFPLNKFQWEFTSEDMVINIW